MRIIIDPDRCCGHGLCYAVAPSLVGDDERGYGVVIRAAVDPSTVDQAHRAVASCPEQAVSLADG